VPGPDAHGAGPAAPPTLESAVDRLLAAERATFQRVEPADLPAEVAAGALVVDLRPVEDRRAGGELPGAIVVDRLVLEWRLDPTSPHRLAALQGPDQRVVLVCNEGYASSLAAATLRRLGLRRATDLVGGFRGLQAHRSN
jgi:rhodanese-related sulfurtransferase